MGKANGQKAAQNPSEDPHGSPDSVSQLLNSLGDPTGLQVCVYELEADGERRMLRTFAIADFDPFAFAEEYGGGRYLAVVREVVSKKFRGQREFRVSDRVQGSRAKAAQEASARPAAPAAPADGGMLSTLLAMLQSQTQQTTAVLTAMISRPSDGITAKDLIPLMAAQSQKPAQGADLGTMVDALTKLDALRSSGQLAGAAEGAPPWAAAIPAVLEGVKMLAGDGAAKPAAPAPGKTRIVLVKEKPPAAVTGVPHPAPAPAGPAPAGQGPDDADDDDHDDAIDQAKVLRTLGELIVGAVAVADGDVDPGALAGRVLDTLDLDALEAVLADTPPGGLADRVAGELPGPVAMMVKMPRHAAQLGELEAALRAELQLGAQSAPGGPRGPGPIEAPAGGGPVQDDAGGGAL